MSTNLQNPNKKYPRNFPTSMTNLQVFGSITEVSSMDVRPSITWILPDKDIATGALTLSGVCDESVMCLGFVGCSFSCFTSIWVNCKYIPSTTKFLYSKGKLLGVKSCDITIMLQYQVVVLDDFFINSILKSFRTSNHFGRIDFYKAPSPSPRFSVGTFMLKQLNDWQYSGKFLWPLERPQNINVIHPPKTKILMVCRCFSFSREAFSGLMLVLGSVMIQWWIFVEKHGWIFWDSFLLFFNTNLLKKNHWHLGFI